VPRWGAKSTAIVLGRYLRLEDIPESSDDWDVQVRGARSLATSLVEHRDDARLFRTLATLRTDARLFHDVEELRWKGPTPRFEALAARLGAPGLWRRAMDLAGR
jgi:hypothetical protein